jgi:hypothetical protein
LVSVSLCVFGSMGNRANHNVTGHGYTKVSTSDKAAIDLYVKPGCGGSPWVKGATCLAHVTSFILLSMSEKAEKTDQEMLVSGNR